MPDGQSIGVPILSADGISKSFGSVPVLFSVSMDIRAGEVHALIGENGAGKSTFMKILSGFLQPTSGHIRLDGVDTELPGNGQSEALGIVLIHQELNPAEQMTVEENIFLGREIMSRGVLDRATMRAMVRGYLDDIGLDISPEDRISDLSIAQKQMVEIVKAISRDARVLIMDEPTAVLTEAETELFFAQVRRLKARGTAIVFVSHKLAEVSAISDQVTVLRDGQWIGTHAAKDVTPDTMAQMMVGRELSDLYPPMNEVDVDADRVLDVRDLVAPGVHNVSFDLRKGEILGFSGLIGAGRTAVFEAICGLTPREGGTVAFDGAPANFTSVAAARDAGIVYLTKDRKEKGLLLGQKMRPNLSLFALPKFVKGLSVDRKAEDAALERAIRRFDIRARDPNVNVGDLSGGNQQKLLLAKVMECDPRILIIDEPTRGIDVGTKQQIYPWPQRPPGLIDTAFDELAKRWRPILDHADQMGVDICYEIHPGEDLHDGVTFEMFLDRVDNHARCNMLYDPSHFVLQCLDYVGHIDDYADRIKMFHVKDAEFNPTTKQGVYGGYQSWVDRAGRFRSLGDGQVDFGKVFSKMAANNFDGWAVVEWECCLKHPEDGAREGAAFVRDHIIRVTETAFDDFADGGTDEDANKRMLGIS